MRRFIFRCPQTGYIVKAEAEDADPEKPPHAYEEFQCTACGGLHLIDPGTGEVLEPPGKGR